MTTRLVHPTRWYAEPTAMTCRGGHPLGATKGEIVLMRSTVLLFTCTRCHPTTYGLVLVAVECGAAVGHDCNVDQYALVKHALAHEAPTLKILELLGYHTSAQAREGAA